MKLQDGVVAVVLLLTSGSLAWAQAPEPAEEPPPEGAAPDQSAPDTSASASAEAGAEGEAGAEAEATSEPEAEAPTSSAQSDRDTIIITGSRVRSRTFGSAVPVEVIDQKQLAKAGAKNLGDVVQYLVGSQGAGALGDAGNLGGAATTANLRGLGAGATLVLLNGRRLNPSGAALNATFADMSVVPLAAVERLEVLKAGASAIYGADAVGGVINIITRRNWDGAKLQVDGQSTTRWDHSEYTASASIGTASEHGRMLTAVSYFRRSELISTQRSYPPDKFTAPPAVWPPIFIDYTSPLPMKPQLKDPVCDRTSGFCTPFYGEYISLIPNSERANAFANAEYDLSPHVTMLAELTVSRFRGDSMSLPSFNVIGKTLLIPANHVDNPWGRPLALVGAPLGAPTGATRETFADDTFRAVLGLKGDLNGVTPALQNWEWEAYTSYGISRFRESVDDNLVDALQLAINSCSDPGNLSNCFNPFYSAYDGTGTPNTNAVIDRFRSRQLLQADHALQTYNLGLSGALFALPGGDVGLAIGGEIRREWRVVEFDHDANQLRFGFLAGNTNQSAHRQVYGGYAELRWPFYRGVELRTAARLERYTDTQVNAMSPFAAVTISPGDILGRDRSPGALQRLQFRGAASRAFRAPTISNTAPGYGTAPAPLQYAMQKGSTMTASTYVPIRYYGNPDLKPETAITFSGGMSWTPINEIALSGDYWYYNYKDRIQPENPQGVLTNFQNGGEMPPPPGTRLPVEIDPTTRALTGVNVSYINLPGSIRTSGVDFSLNFHIDGTTFGGGREDFGQFGLGVDGTYTIDFSLPRKDAGGAFATNCTGPNPTDTCNVVGFRNYYTDPVALPRVHANFPLTWGFGSPKVAHTFAVIGHYISGFADDFPRPVPPAVPVYPQIPAWLSLDLQYSLTLKQLVGKEVTVRVGCQNVTDKMPPIVLGTATYFATEVHDPRGRMVYGSLSAEF